MDPRVKRLLAFCAEEPTSILITPCELKKESWFENLKFIKEIICTSTECEGEVDCIKMNPQGFFLPFDRFNIWILDLSHFPYSPGYAFYTGYQTLKDFGIIAIIGEIDSSLDSIALSYGFQILYNGEWHYYLKAGKGTVIE